MRLRYYYSDTLRPLWATPWPVELLERGGGIPGNDLGHGSTSPSTFAHVLGVSGATIGAVGGAADGRWNMGNASFGTAMRVPKRGPVRW